MEKLEDFIKKMAKVINESDKNELFYEEQTPPPSYNDVLELVGGEEHKDEIISQEEYDDLTDEEKLEYYENVASDVESEKESEKDSPSYADIEKLYANSNDKSEEKMSREEYDNLSTDEKDEIHQSAKQIDKISGDNDSEEETNMSKWNRELSALRQHEKERRNRKTEEKFRKDFGYTGDDEFVDVTKNKHGVQIKDTKGKGGQNAFMFICERVEKYGDKKKSGYKELVYNYDKNVQDWFVTNRDEIIQDMEVVEERTETIQGDSVEQLQDMMNERLKYFQEKYKIDLNDGWEIGSYGDSKNGTGSEIEYNKDLEDFNDDEEGSETEDGGKKKPKKDKNPVLEPPKEIRDIDEGAFGYMYYKISGDKKVLPPEYQGKRGRPPEGTWDTKLNAIILEYIIYTSNAVLKGDGFSDMLQKKFGEN